MSKTVIRYFIDFTEKQEKWLNEMAVRGFRLVRCGKLTYTFERAADEYQYRVEFAGEKSYSKHKDYKRFLEDLGYRVIPKNININWSAGKVRIRPWAEGVGKIAASPGTYNREVLIVEKLNDGKPFELHTNAEDLAARFKIIRNSYLWTAIVGLAGAAFLFTKFYFASAVWAAWCGAAAFGLAGAVCALFSAKYAGIAKRYKEIAKTNE